MQEEDFEKEIKVIVVGNGGVGKTSMIKRFCKGVFTSDYKKTIGVDFLEKVQYVDSLGEEIRFHVWDTAGQEEFNAITRTYYRGARAAVLAFSTIDRASFDAIESWKDKVEAECGGIAMCLVQNKVDLLPEALMTPQEVEDLARRLRLKLYRTCVKENVNVLEVFSYLAVQDGHISASGGPIAIAATKPGGGGSSGAGALTAPSTKPGFGGDAQDGQREGGAAVHVSGQARTVDLKPSKQRTGGKKQVKDRMGKCSIS